MSRTQDVVVEVELAIMCLVATVAGQVRTREELCNAFEMFEPGQLIGRDLARFGELVRHRTSMMRDGDSKRKRKNAQCANVVPKGINENADSEVVQRVGGAVKPTSSALAPAMFNCATLSSFHVKLPQKAKIIH